MVTIIYIVTILISIIIGAFLVYMSGLRAHPVKNKKSTKISATFKPQFEDPLEYALFEEINAVLELPEKSKEIAQRLSTVVNKEIEKKIVSAKEEIKRSYENIIEEKTKNEEIAWKKFKEVLLDKRETEAVIRSIAEGLVVVDSQGNVVMMNPAAEKLLGVSHREKAGKSIFEGLKEQ
ncbi:MAG: PAS domain-containing protein [Candidatus Omnitrophica bacterium]|nr:PAS domain-containing protein [Candidatus Omnitrophota bacterium]